MLALYRCLLASMVLMVVGEARSEEPIDPEIAFDEAILKDHQIAANTAGILDFLHRRTLDKAGQRHIEAAIVKLGDKRYAVRESASKELVAVGIPAVPFLRVAENHADLEVSERAKICQDRIAQANSSNVAYAVLRLIERKQIIQAVEPLIAFLPFADNSYVEAEAFRVLGKVALREGKPVIDLTATVRDTLPIRRAVAGFILGRSTNPEDRALARTLLKDAEPWVQFRTAQGLLTGKDKAAIPALIALLENAPMEVIWQVEEQLYPLAQDKFPEAAKEATPEGRKAYRKSWDAWWVMHEATLDLTKIPSETAIRGLTIGIEYNTNRVWECGLDGKRRWTIENLSGPMDAQVLVGNRVLIAEQSGNIVTERDLTGKILWEKKLDESPLNAQRLPNGNTFIGTRYRVMEVRPNGTEVFAHRLAEDYLHAVRRLPDGSFIGLANTGKIYEMDAAGKTTKITQITNEGSWGDIMPLPGGGYLVTNTASGFLRELDAKGEKVREVAFNDACGLQRISDSRILVSGGNRLALVDWTGKSLWETKSNGYIRRSNRR